MALLVDGMSDLQLDGMGWSVPGWKSVKKVVKKAASAPKAAARTVMKLPPIAITGRIARGAVSRGAGIVRGGGGGGGGAAPGEEDQPLEPSFMTERAGGGMAKIPWKPILIGLGVLGAGFMLLRRRRVAVSPLAVNP